MSKKIARSSCINQGGRSAAFIVFLLAALTAVLLPRAAFAQPSLPGGAAPCTDLENCGEIVTKPRTMESIGLHPEGAPFIPMGKFESQRTKVRTTSGELAGKLITRGEVPKSDIVRGNEDFDSTWDDDLDIAVEKFEQCQSDDNQHELDDLTNWIYPIIEGIITRATGWGDDERIMFGCVSHFGYSGPVVGSCWYAHEEDCNCPFDCTICGCVYGASWSTWDLIEYYYPTGRVNVSEQPYQSRYIKPEDYEAGQEFMDSTGYQRIGDNMKTAYTNMQDAVKASVPIVTGKAGDLKFGTFDDKATKAKDDAIKAMKELPDKLPLGFTEDPRGRNTSDMYAEARYYTEDEVDGVAGGFLGFSNIPHYPKYDPDARVLTDPGADSRAWPMAQILQESEFDSGRWGPYLSPDSGVRGARCVENNKTFLNTTQKTPDDLWSAVGASSDHDFQDMILEIADNAYLNPISLTAQLTGLTNNNVCLDGVGEVFPYTHYARLHPTDKIFAGALKMAQFTDALDAFWTRGISDNLVFTFAEFTKYHTFVHQWDKFVLLDDIGFANNSLKDDLDDKCEPMEKKMTALGFGGAIGADNYIAKRNVEMKASTVKEAKNASEATFEIYTLFKGCYAGGIGQQDIPFGFASGNLALPPHGWTSIEWGGEPRDDCMDVTSGPCWQDHDAGILPKGLMRTH